MPKGIRDTDDDAEGMNGAIEARIAGPVEPNMVLQGDCGDGLVSRPSGGDERGGLRPGARLRDDGG